MRLELDGVDVVGVDIVDADLVAVDVVRCASFDVRRLGLKALLHLQVGEVVGCLSLKTACCHQLRLACKLYRKPLQLGLDVFGLLVQVGEKA